MKELNLIHKDQIEIHGQKKKTTIQYNSSIRYQRGLKLWEIPVENFDLETMQPVDVTPKIERVHWNQVSGKIRKFDPKNPEISIPFMMKKNHFYCTALNPKNAIKKYIRFRLQLLKERSSQ